MHPVLPPSFFDRPTLEVARDLLGKTLVRRFPDGTTRALRITEVEAYDGPDDKASHTSKGRTPRTEVMFGESGHFYIYLCYGLHWMLNIVTGPAPASGLWFEDRDEAVGKIKFTTRIGVDYAGKWVKKKWRFIAEGKECEYC